MVRNDARPNILNGHMPPDAVPVSGFARAATVFLQGDPAAHWYVVRQGVLRTCRFRLDGQRQLTGFYFPGDAVGFETGHYLTTAEAVTEARVECYSQQSAPIASKQIERALANANRYIMLLGHRTAAERVAAFLIGLPHDGDHVAVPMSRADIADYLGLTNPHHQQNLFRSVPQRAADPQRSAPSSYQCARGDRALGGRRNGCTAYDQGRQTCLRY